MSVSTAVHEGLFVGEPNPHLLGSRCARCGGHHFPVHTTCPYCSSDEVSPVALSDHGTLWAWTAVTAAPPGYEGEVPFGFGVIELPEGVRVITRLTISDPAALAIGQPMKVVVAPLTVGVVTYAFGPAT